jgi:hypothetical protein
MISHSDPRANSSLLSIGSVGCPNKAVPEQSKTALELTNTNSPSWVIYYASLVLRLGMGLKWVVDLYGVVVRQLCLV